MLLWPVPLVAWRPRRDKPSENLEIEGSRALRLFLALMTVGGLIACGVAGPPDSAGDAAESGEERPREQAELFTERAEAAGLRFVHDAGVSGRFYQPEIMGPGVALVDHDNDGDLDVYLVQGGFLGPASERPAENPTGRLFRNDLEAGEAGARRLRFTDVTEASGIVTRGYGMGVAAGDIDNDGWIDLYITGFRGNQMFRNDGDGTFTDVSRSSGTDAPDTWGVSAAFVDVDRDGWLDLFVGNYLAYSFAAHVDCTNAAGVPDYCRPEAYRPQPNRFYRNRGDGRFADATVTAGFAREFGPALGVSTADFNGDGWLDIFVANDQQENQLWINQRDGTFTNTALVAGVAVGASGELKADMGVDAGDFDNDGDEDLFVTELTAQGSTLYVNDGSGVFEEQSASRGLRQPSLPYTGFGAAWLDYDNDGWLDILSVNGLVNQRPDTPATQEAPFPLEQRNQLFRNAGGRFEDVTGRAGAAFDLVEVSRGAAFGDIDNDGDTDVVIANGNGPARLLINNGGGSNHWLGLRLLHTEGRDAIGAHVIVERSSGPALRRRARSDGSYASANDPRVLAGLGASDEAPSVRVFWPSGRVEEWDAVQVDMYTTLAEGTGRPAAEAPPE